MVKMMLLQLSLMLSVSVFSQLQITEPDKSPMDMSYCPYGYPILKFQGKNSNINPLARVIYSRPQKKGRVLFGTEIPYGEIWRLGANESTEIEFFTTCNFGGKKITKGRYTLFCIPNSSNWTFIVSRDVNSWGAFSYKTNKDFIRATVPVTKSNEIVEFFTIYFDAANNMVILWDDVKVTVPLTFSNT